MNMDKRHVTVWPAMITTAVPEFRLYGQNHNLQELMSTRPRTAHAKTHQRYPPTHFATVIPPISLSWTYLACIHFTMHHCMMTTNLKPTWPTAQSATKPMTRTCSLTRSK